MLVSCAPCPYRSDPFIARGSIFTSRAAFSALIYPLSGVTSGLFVFVMFAETLYQLSLSLRAFP